MVRFTSSCILFDVVLCVVLFFFSVPLTFLDKSEEITSSWPRGGNLLRCFLPGTRFDSICIVCTLRYVQCTVFRCLFLSMLFVLVMILTRNPDYTVEYHLLVSSSSYWWIGPPVCRLVMFLPTGRTRVTFVVRDRDLVDLVGIQLWSNILESILGTAQTWKVNKWW